MWKTPSLTAWLEPAARMLESVPVERDAEKLAEEWAERFRKNPPLHMHPDARIEVSKMQRGKRVIVATVKI